jgi:rubrerythrin
VQKWKCKNCGFVYVGNTARQTCVKCHADATYTTFEPAHSGPSIPWKCRVCGYAYEDDTMMELCPFCGAECSFVDNANYLPPDQQQQKPLTDKTL